MRFRLAKSKGFTLIELLVVVSIVSLLASIVLASLNSVRGKARDTRRLEDLHQINLALELYASSNNGAYPDLYSYNVYYFISDNNYPGTSGFPPCATVGGLQGYLAGVCSYKDTSGNPYTYTSRSDGTPKLGAKFETTSVQGTPFTYWNGSTNVSVAGYYEQK